MLYIFRYCTSYNQAANYSFTIPLNRRAIDSFSKNKISSVPSALFASVFARAAIEPVITTGDDKLALGGLEIKSYRISHTMLLHALLRCIVFYTAVWESRN